MDVATARRLLTDMMVHLPNDVWCLLRQVKVNDIGIARVLGRSCKEIDALLVNTGICKETPAKGIRIAKNWSTILQSVIADVPLPTTIHVGDIRNKVWYIKKGDGGCVCPADQKMRIVISPPDLPDDIISRLRLSWEHYDEKKLNDEQQKKKNTVKKTIDDNKKKKNDYPTFSKMFSTVKDISLQHPEIDSFCKNILTEIVQLHECAGIPLSLKHPNGKDMTLEPLEVCSNKRQRESSTVVSPKLTTVSS